jgi:hypothetical protein
MALLLVLLASGRSFALEEPEAPAGGQENAKPAPKPDAAPDRAQLEKWFAETMSGATLIGHFTVDGRGAGEPKEERYTIQKVTKLQGDNWLFVARIQFGEKDVAIPIRIPVKWAGDTAVISVTDMGFPGLGTYTARVLIYGDQYAGTWSGKAHGGHLWGRIERADKDATRDSAPQPQKQESPKREPVGQKPDATR